MQRTPKTKQESLVKLTLQSKITLLTYEIEVKREAVSSAGPGRTKDLAYYITDEVSKACCVVET
jgi:hypothetical protein